MNGFSFPFLSFQVRVLMETNLRPLITTKIITFCIFLSGGGGGCDAWDRFSHNSRRTKILVAVPLFQLLLLLSIAPITPDKMVVSNGNLNLRRCVKSLHLFLKLLWVKQNSSTCLICPFPP